MSSDIAVMGVEPAQTLKASKALLAHMKKVARESVTNTNKKDLLAADEEDEASMGERPIWLNLSTKRHITDTTRLRPGKIILPHSLNTDPNLRICIISADPQRAYKNLVASPDFPDAWRKRITRVIGLTKLTAKFKQYEEQRKLFAEHDVFLGDDRIISRLPKVLGKTFYKTTLKRPIPVNLQARLQKIDRKRVKRPEGTVNVCTPKELAAEVEKAVGAALVNLSPSPNAAIRIGLAKFTAEQIAENARAVANALVEKYVPQKWKNVQGIYLKGPETTSLPIWLTDQLWLDQKDIVADGASQAHLSTAEKPNIGKKRKSLEETTEQSLPASKKVKESKAQALPESNDDKLDKKIAERRIKLKKQKAAAKKAVDV